MGIPVESLPMAMLLYGLVALVASEDLIASFRMRNLYFFVGRVVLMLLVMLVMMLMMLMMLIRFYFVKKVLALSLFYVGEPESEKLTDEKALKARSALRVMYSVWLEREVQGE